MKIYLVGGSIRDQLLGLPVKDHDWVVVGSSPEELLSKGYEAVGKKFPIFIHPQSHEEYALARTEHKIAPGYHGFIVKTASDITLEEDLLRRDLTINAIAQSVDGHIVDPFNGQKDIEDKVLRHVSPAFVEDPVRVLRIARFAARFRFKIAGETKNLIKKIIISDELKYLVAERVWKELKKALTSKKPSLFFTTLREIGALNDLFPDIDRLFGVKQIAKWHPEIDTGIHAMMAIDQAALLTEDIMVRFATLCHDLGKGTTHIDMIPNHLGHEERSVHITEKLCKNLCVPNSFKSLALKVAKYHTHTHLLFEMRSETILNVIEALDAFRRPKILDLYLLAVEADFKGRIGYENTPMPEIAAFKSCFNEVYLITAKPFITDGLRGSEIAIAMHNQRIIVLNKIIMRWKAIKDNH